MIIGLLYLRPNVECLRCWYAWLSLYCENCCYSDNKNTWLRLVRHSRSLDSEEWTIQFPAFEKLFTFYSVKWQNCASYLSLHFVLYKWVPYLHHSTSIWFRFIHSIYLIGSQINIIMYVNKTLESYWHRDFFGVVDHIAIVTEFYSIFRNIIQFSLIIKSSEIKRTYQFPLCNQCLWNSKFEWNELSYLLSWDTVTIRELK